MPKKWICHCFQCFQVRGSEVRLPVYQMEPHSTDCRVILYKLTYLSEEWILRYTRSYLYLFLTEHPHQRPSHTPKVFPFWDWRNVNPTYRSTQVGKLVSLLKFFPSRCIYNSFLLNPTHFTSVSTKRTLKPCLLKISFH